jgi:hypothetical protein
MGFQSCPGRRSFSLKSKLSTSGLAPSAINPRGTRLSLGRAFQLAWTALAPVIADGLDASRSSAHPPHLLLGQVLATGSRRSRNFHE